MGKIALKGLLFILSVLCGMGCSTPLDPSGLAGGGASGNGPVDLSPGSSGATSAAVPPASTGTSTSSGSTSATTDLPQPGTSTAPPSGPNNLPPTEVASLAAQTAITELAGRGITISGSYTDDVVRNTLICARQLKKEDTRNMKINFTSRSPSGVLGYWASSQITIYAPDKPTAILHEMCHHVSWRTGSKVGDQVVEWIKSNYGVGEDLDTWPDAVITDGYARTNYAEFRAEFFSVLRVMDLKLNWEWLAENASSGKFNPPAALRQIAANFYDTGSASEVD